MSIKDFFAVLMLLISTIAGGFVGLNTGVRLIAAMRIVEWLR